MVAAALAAAAALAWAWLLRAPMADPGDMAAMGMGPEPLSAAYLLPAFAMWAVMMVAMMVPSAAPMVLLRARIDKAPSRRLRMVNSALFILAYLAVWTGFAAAAALAQAVLIESGAVSAMELSIGSRASSSLLLLAAAVYELTAAKRVCLDKCRSPIAFILRHRTPGAAGALRLGLAHGAFCVGCCWALMLLLFVGGVMNLAWVALIGIVVIAEKFAPTRWRAERFVAAALSLAAIAMMIA